MLKTKFATTVFSFSLSISTVAVAISLSNLIICRYFISYLSRMPYRILLVEIYSDQALVNCELHDLVYLGRPNDLFGGNICSEDLSRLINSHLLEIKNQSFPLWQNVTLNFSRLHVKINFFCSRSEQIQLQIPRLEYEIKSASIYGKPTAARKFSE